MKYNLEYADKSKIINYNPEPIPAILKFLYDFKSKNNVIP